MSEGANFDELRRLLEKDEVQAAAKAEGLSIDAFVQRAIEARVCYALGERSPFLVKEDEWDELEVRLNRPPTYRLGIARLFQKYSSETPPNGANENE